MQKGMAVERGESQKFHGIMSGGRVVTDALGISDPTPLILFCGLIRPERQPLKGWSGSNQLSRQEKCAVGDSHVMARILTVKYLLVICHYRGSSV